MEDVHEGDVVCLFCPDAKGFVYAQSPCSRYSQVTIYQVPTADGELTMLTDPVLPNIHSASFKILSENTMISQDNDSPLCISEVPIKSIYVLLVLTVVFRWKNSI
jgi:inositol 1,4,5-triphosphate receptor type 1